MITGIVFDMDGVIFDTERLCNQSWLEAAEYAGIADINELMKQCVGLNNNDTKAAFLNYYGHDFNYEAFRKKTSSLMVEYIKKEGIPVKAGVREFLSELKRQKFPIALATSTRRERVIKLLTGTNLLTYFDLIVTGDMVEHSKPNPEIYQIACRGLKKQPAECLAIEDSPNGILSAYAAGMKPVMVIDLIQPTTSLLPLLYRQYNNMDELADDFSSLT